MPLKDYCIKKRQLKMSKNKQKYIKVKTEGVFNLNLTAEEFNLTTLELVSFHNQYCTIHELLPLSLPKYVEYIYLPVENFIERDQKLLKSVNVVKPEVISEKTYGVVVNFLPKELSIHYKIKVTRTGKVLELNKYKTYVNNLEIDQTVEQLFEKAEQVLYPLQMSLTGDGGLNKILNGKEIGDRWKKDCLPDLKDYYQSETSDKILHQLDKAFANVDAKKELLVRNTFYKLYFLPIYQNYPTFLKDDLLEIYFSSIGQAVSYKIVYELQKEFTRGKKIGLRIKGIEEESLFNKGQELGEIDLLYKLDKETKEVYSITGLISSFERNERHQIDFQLYELNNS